MGCGKHATGSWRRGRAAGQATEIMLKPQAGLNLDNLVCGSFQLPEKRNPEGSKFLVLRTPLFLTLFCAKHNSCCSTLCFLCKELPRVGHGRDGLGEDILTQLPTQYESWAS